MLEDEQRFEELEAKLAALSSQVEGLELEKEIDPFFEDDVRRLIEDFREKEIVDVEEDEESFDSEDSVEPDFIDVQTTGGRTFKVHWIAPDSCEEMTKTKARAAFAAGAASRYGTSQQVNGGDVLILLCRKPTEEPPASFCHYIGMAVNTGLNPTSLEPDTSGVEAITSAVGNYQIFVWSSCECSVESSEPVTFTSLIPSDNSSESEPGSYLKLGETGSFSPSSAEVVTDISIETGDLQAPIDAMSAVALKDSTKTTNQSGFKTKLVNLSESLTENYINHVSKNLTLQGDTQNLIGGNFNTSQYQSKNLELSSTECGGLEAVSISGESYDLNLLGLAEDDSGFTGVIKSADISLGVSISSQAAIPSYRATAEDIEHDKNAFIPILSDDDADAIETSDSFSTRDVASVSISSTNETNAPLKNSVITLNKSGSSKSFASGLLKDQTDLADVSISTTAFPVIDREHVQDWTGLGVSGLNLFSSNVTEKESGYVVSIGVNLEYRDLGFETGLLHTVGNSTSLGNSVSIEIPKQTATTGATDNAVSIASNLNFTGLTKRNTPQGVTVSLGAYWNSHQSEFDAGLFKGDSQDVAHSSQSSFELAITDLVSLGTDGTAGSYIKELQNLSGAGSYQSDGSIDLQLQFNELRSELGFNKNGFYKGESAVDSTNSSVSINVPAVTLEKFPSIGKTGSTSLSYLSGLRLQATSLGFSLFNSSKSSSFDFNKGLYQSDISTNPSETEIGTVSFPEIPEGINTETNKELASFSVVSESTEGVGTTYTLSLTPQKHISEFEKGLLKSLSISPGSVDKGTIFVPDPVTVSLSSSIQIVQNPTVEVIGQYDSIYADNATGEVVGDARYYVNYTADLYDTEFVDGELKIKEQPSKTITNILNGPIIVKGTRIRYGCDPDYGCIIDPAGDYDEPGCGSGCYEYEEDIPDPVLTYRPSEVYLYNYYPDSNCYVYLQGYNLDSAAEGNDVSTQYYSNKINGNPGARYVARYDANDNVETVFQYDAGAGNYVDLSGTEVVRDLEVAQELLCTALEGTIISEYKSGNPNDVGFEETVSFAPLTSTIGLNINWNDRVVGDVLQVFTQKVNEAEIKRVDVEDYQEPNNESARLTTVVELEPGTIKLRVNVFSRATESTAWDLSVDAFKPDLDRPNDVYIYKYIAVLECNYPVYQFVKIPDGATDDVQYYEDSAGNRGKYELDGLDSVFYVKDNGGWVLPETIDGNYILNTTLPVDACQSSDTLLSELVPLTYEQSSTNSINEYVYFRPDYNNNKHIDVNFENYFTRYTTTYGGVHFASTVVEITYYNISGDSQTILTTASNLGHITDDVTYDEFGPLQLPAGTFALNIKLTPSWRGSGSKVTIEAS